MRVSVRRLFAVASVSVAVLAPPTATAASPRLPALLGSLWTRVFELPVDTNPFTGGDPCLVLDDPVNGKPILAPFASPANSTCTVPLGTKLFLTGWSSECSNLEGPPFEGHGEADLRDCAEEVDAGLNDPVVTFDGRAVRMHEVQTALIEVDLADQNVFGQTPGTHLESVGHGWVALLALPPGTHTVTIHTTGFYPSPPPGGPLDVFTTTTIIVTH